MIKYNLASFNDIVEHLCGNFISNFFSSYRQLHLLPELWSWGTCQTHVGVVLQVFILSGWLWLFMSRLQWLDIVHTMMVFLKRDKFLISIVCHV